MCSPATQEPCCSRSSCRDPRPRVSPGQQSSLRGQLSLPFLLLQSLLPHFSGCLLLSLCQTQGQCLIPFRVSSGKSPFPSPFGGLHFHAGRDREEPSSTCLGAFSGHGLHLRDNRASRLICPSPSPPSLPSSTFPCVCVSVHVCCVYTYHTCMLSCGGQRTI